MQVAALGLMAAAPALADTIRVAAGPDAQERLQAALIEAKAGDMVDIGAGRFDLTDGLSLDVNGVTIRGAGPDKTILSFKGQQDIWTYSPDTRIIVCELFVNSR